WQLWSSHFEIWSTHFETVSSHFETLQPTPEAQPALSCAELVLRGEQDVLVNDWMACVVGQYTAALLRRQPIRTFATFISLDGMSIRSLPICREELKAYLREG
ncbi:MAG: hypothetical protein L6Q98_22790, partial [Anaerolineae bacterium]|nr:hypothetical protein [Anaerolineae bacterium]